MSWTKKGVIKHLKESLIIALFGFPAGLLFCTQCISSFELIMKVGIYSSFLWVLMWKGNESIAHRLDVKIDWLKYPLRRLMWGAILHIVYPSAIMFIINFTFYKLYGWNSEIVTLKGALTYSIPAVIITYLIAMFMTARDFFINWRQLAIDQEKMKREVLTSQLETLKSQVNPHFLFNSLNVLTSLVYKDADTSAKFIKELSNVYRYVLEVSDKELVDLNDEVRFLKSYIYLMKMRHSEGLIIELDLPEKGQTQVAPLALQMLVENAVKHNVVSKEEPLNIWIKSNDGYITVANNLQRKDRREEKDSHIGLHNINARYKFLTNQAIEILETDEVFEVKLPMLAITDH